MPVRSGIHGAFAAEGAAIKPSHVGFGPALVDEDQPAPLDFRSLLAPFITLGFDIRAILFGGAK